MMMHIIEEMSDNESSTNSLHPRGFNQLNAQQLIFNAQLSAERLFAEL